MEESGNSWFWIVSIILAIWFWHDHSSLTGQVELLQNQVADLDSQVSQYSDDLDQANSNIEDAKSSAWSSYDEMGDALDNLETVTP